MNVLRVRILHAVELSIPGTFYFHLLPFIENHRDNVDLTLHIAPQTKAICGKELSVDLFKKASTEKRTIQRTPHGLTPLNKKRQKLLTSAAIIHRIK